MSHEVRHLWQHSMIDNSSLIKKVSPAQGVQYKTIEVYAVALVENGYLNSVKNKTNITDVDTARRW